MAAAPAAEPKPLSPLVQKMLAVAWREIEPNLDALYTSVTDKVNKLFTDLMAKVVKGYADLKAAIRKYLGLPAKA